MKVCIISIRFLWCLYESYIGTRGIIESKTLASRGDKSGTEQ